MAQRALRHQPVVVLRRLGRRPRRTSAHHDQDQTQPRGRPRPGLVRRFARYADTARVAPAGFAFSDDGGTSAWKPNRVTKAFLRHRRAAVLRPFRLHDLRHFMATEMLDAGVPIVVVPVGSITSASRPHSTNTPTQSPAATPAPRRPCMPSSPDRDLGTVPRPPRNGTCGRRLRTSIASMARPGPSARGRIHLRAQSGVTPERRRCASLCRCSDATESLCRRR